jgi:hypothetical protein
MVCMHELAVCMRHVMGHLVVGIVILKYSMWTA